MIDTDNYEGHYTYHESSVKLWNTDDAVLSDYDFFWVTNSKQLNADEERANATINLIADAPLILAEYKRLRNIILKFDDAIYHGNFDISQLLGIWYNLLTKEEEE